MTLWRRGAVSDGLDAGRDGHPLGGGGDAVEHPPRRLSPSRPAATRTWEHRCDPGQKDARQGRSSPGSGGSRKSFLKD